MKKLLSLLSVITITSSTMPSLIATSSPPYDKKEQTNKLENNKINNKKISRFKKHISNLNLINSFFINKDNFNVRQINEITNSVNHITVFPSTIGTTVANSLYFATDNGVYFMGADWRIRKINGINEAIISVTIAPKSGNAFAITKTGKSYFISNTPGNYDAIKITEISDYINSITVYQNDISDNVKANGLYFATDNGVYFMHDDNLLKPDKINGINEAVISVTIAPKSGNAFAITKTGKSYFINKDNFNVRQINEITNSVNHITVFPSTIGTTVANSLYFATDNGVYFMGADWRIRKINGINETVISVTIAPKSGNAFAITKTGKSYFISNTPGNYDAIKITEISDYINSITVYQNDISDNVKANGLYFATDNGVYFMHDDNLLKPDKINGINEAVISVTIAPKSGNAFAITKNKVPLNHIIIQINNLIFNNIINDETILNELNYLNPNLDISQLEIINKTNTSAIIKAKENGKYFDEFTVNYKIKNKYEVNVINLNELIKKAIFFKFRDEKSNLKFKKINYIDTNNLNFWNVEVTRNSELLYSVDFRNACFNKKTFSNFSLINIQKYNIPKCDYSTKSKIVFQITKGLSKINKENKLNDWNISVDDEIKINDFINVNNKDFKIINELSNSFDLSNTNKQEQETILHTFNENENEISIDSKTKLEIAYSIREINLETTLNLKQKITGTIIAKIIDDNNEEQIITLSIKEAMQILQKYSLLPNEITINEDNSITFNGKAKITLTQEATPQLITKTSNI